MPKNIWHLYQTYKEMANAIISIVFITIFIIIFQSQDSAWLFFIPYINIIKAIIHNNKYCEKKSYLPLLSTATIATYPFIILWFLNSSNQWFLIMATTSFTLLNIYINILIRKIIKINIFDNKYFNYITTFVVYLHFYTLFSLLGTTIFTFNEMIGDKLISGISKVAFLIKFSSFLWAANALIIIILFQYTCYKLEQKNFKIQK